MKIAKPDNKFTAVAIAITLVSLAAAPAFAVEGGLGRPISGAAVNPYAAVIPPAPGFAVTVQEEYYDGSISGSTTVPIANLLTLGIDLKASFTLIEGSYIWNTSASQWNFASAVAFPITWLETEATITAGPRTGRVRDSASGLFDMIFVPIIASYHISKTDHFAFTVTVWAPTGDYEKGRLANLSTNTWTFIPGAAYTKIFPESNIEFSALWEMTFDTRNDATNYQNGVLSDLEATVIKRFQSGAGLGIVGSWIQQITEDGGPTADQLNGFRGHVVGVGPIITFAKDIGKQNLSINARWVHEFDAEKRVQGDLFALGGTFKF